MSEQQTIITSTSRAAATRNAGQYLREQRNYDTDVTHEQLVHVVSRALKPKGTVLARETVQLFLRAFDISDEHARILWRHWAGADLARVVFGQLALADIPDFPTDLPYETVSLREYHYLGPDGRPLKHRAVRDIRSLADGLTQYRYSFDTSELAVERISGGQPGAPYQRHGSVWSVETCLRRVAPDRFENVVIRVEFDPRRLPRSVYWTEWLDYREPNIRIVQEDPVSLASEHAAHHRLDVLQRAVVGFRWEF